VKKYYLLANGEKVDAAEVIAAIQEEDYFILYFIYGSSVEQKGKLIIAEEEIS
jgi:hypothetical protein